MVGFDPKEGSAFTNTFTIHRGPIYKSYREDADLQNRAFLSVVLQRLIFP